MKHEVSGDAPNSLPPLAEIEPAPARRGARLNAEDSPCFDIGAEALWRAWLEVAAGMPRTRLVARDDPNQRSFHIQRTRILRLPDLVRVEIIASGPSRSGFVMDSRARYGYSDLGVNRRRIKRWLAALREAVGR